jgi:hypothetical protein
MMTLGIICVSVVLCLGLICGIELILDVLHERRKTNAMREVERDANRGKGSH